MMICTAARNSACNSTNSPAMCPSSESSAMPHCTGFLKATVKMADTTLTTAKYTKKTEVMSKGRGAARSRYAGTYSGTHGCRNRSSPDCAHRDLVCRLLLEKKKKKKKKKTKKT